ncbi:hypothetical protein GLW08_18410 [Pontibacillus yanchengensis]|uniref:Uncharacterized protein n=2 Tax=Pontibacillus yanchengensis TaxID=462910 RepID=A0ACC7VMA1_9BACI|nr:Ldh family oxidoreductase [Pontibacillus yanchengensis]MYL34989.1 hypothetical protein [Pontibacillus yanchengensis]MYL55299.1 hypothetical protein [Pontibacillus yanchengensis]
MKVTYQELFELCRKVFESCGLPFGCREDCAELITWSECVGYGGVEILEQGMDDLKRREIHQIELLHDSDHLIRVDGAGFPDYVLAKIALDLVESKLVDSPQTIHGYIQSSTTTHLLAYEAVRIAKRGRGGVVHWYENGIPYWAFAFPGDPHPVVLSGDSVEMALPEWHQLSFESYDYVLQATTEKKDLKRAINYILEQNLFDTILSFEEHERIWEQSRKYGALVEETLWGKLYKEAKNVLVESTEQSRLFGTGEHANR